MVSSEVLLHGVSLSEEMQVELGDPRRTRRVQKVVEALSRAPDKSYPATFGNDSQLEGFYRLIRNSALSVEQVLSPHREQTAERSRQLGEVLVLHDTSEMSWSLRDGRLRENLCKISSTRQGFWVHASLVCSADGLRAPLGVVGLRPYAHEEGLDDDEAANEPADEASHVIHSLQELLERLLVCVKPVLHGGQPTSLLPLRVRERRECRGASVAAARCSSQWLGIVVTRKVLAATQ